MASETMTMIEECGPGVKGVYLAGWCYLLSSVCTSCTQTGYEDDVSSSRPGRFRRSECEKFFE